jgi:tagatose-1,6-bisphosphate aldolase
LNGSSLDAIAGSDGRFAVLAMDQRATLRRMLVAAGQPSEDAELSAFKVDIVLALAPLSSGVLLDADYGVEPVRAAGAMPAGVGLLVAAEPVDKDQWNGEPRARIDPERGAEYVVRNHGDALKFLVQWRPDRPHGPGEPDLAGEALGVIRAVVADCRQAGIPSVIEPLVARIPGEPPLSEAAMGELVISSAAQMAGEQPDLLKLEWPGSAEGCRRVTDALGGVPWALLSAGVGFDDFGERVRIALDNGASGFIAGRAIWGEAVTLVGDARVAFLEQTAVPRLAALRDLLGEHGRSWREAAA